MILTLHRYIRNAVISSTAIVLAALLALVAVITFIGELEDIGEGGYGLLQIATFVGLSLPSFVYEMLPVGVLLGALMGLGGIAAGSELIVMRAAGVSSLRLAASVGFIATGIALFAFVLGDYIAPSSSQKAQLTRAHAKAGSDSGQQGDNLWFRDGEKFVRIGRMDADLGAADVTVYEFGDEPGDAAITSAPAATASADGWTLHDVESVRFQNRRAETSSSASQRWRSTLDPDLLGLFAVRPETLSSVELYRYIQYLRGNGQDSGRYQKAFWAKVVTPFSIIVMAILALPFVLGSLRSTTASQRMVVGLIAGIAYYLGNKILGNTGQVFGLSTVLIAWLPTIALSALTAVLLYRAR